MNLKMHKEHSYDINREILMKIQHTAYWVSEIHCQVLLCIFCPIFVKKINVCSVALSLLLSIFCKEKRLCLCLKTHNEVWVLLINEMMI